jgi:hypothetical protein
MAVPFREKLAELVSPLRRIRSKSPFFELAAHRIPTLWSLYRGLLRNSPTDDVFIICIFSTYSYLYHSYSQISFRIRALFRINRHSTGTEATRKFLTQGYKVGMHALYPILEVICEYRQIVACIL